MTWTVSPTIVAPTLAKTPNVTSICQGYNVSATLAGGSGGIGCSNMAEYTLDGGTTWLAYTSGTPIATAGVSTVTIRAFRDNCNPLVPCPSSDTVSVSWTVSDQPIAPILTRVPDVDMICQGSSVSATVVAGSGGVSCTDYYKYRVHNGTSWSAWTTYMIGSNISTTGRTQIEVMAYRTCTGTGCDATDTSLVHWNVDATIVNPTLNKLPNLSSVCDGTDVSATLATSGSGGNGCSDVIESSIDAGLTWSPYTAGTLINTSSLTSVMIRAYRGNCITGGCSPTDTNTLVWTIILAPIEPTITKIPNTNDVCYGATVSATITPGTGGTGCSNYSQYRIYNGTTWTTWYNYTSGNNIVYPSNAQTIQMRAFRGNCTSGCGASDTATASWNVIQSMINPILAKNPNTATVVENTDVSATIQVPGSNGNGCMDVLEFRVDIGSGYDPWNAYTAGNLLSTTGLVAVQVRGFRGNCSGGDICPPADTTLYTWIVVQGPQAPDVVRVPDANDVCNGTTLSATITINGGGVGCTDYAQYRTYNGTTWTAWAAYISGNNISYPAGSTQVQVRAFRGNCDPISGDVSSDTTLVNWNIVPSLVNPILLKNPNVAAVCAGIDVSATIQTPGSGGTSCNDLLEFRADNGSGFSSWQSYIPGDPIPTTGFIQVQVRGFRGGCLSGLICPPADTTIYSWTISAEPIAPVIVRVPNQNDVCRGTALSATITPGTGGSGCTEYYQSRQYNGATWTAWTAYTSGSAIGYGATITKIEIRAFRGNCDISSGCTSSDTSSTFWNIIPGLVRPIIAKNPQLNAICEGVDVSATITTPGSGGVGCSDVMEYRTNNGSGFGAWTAYSGGTLINTLGLTGVEIRANHENCASGDECPATDTIVSWTITAGPIAPQITRVPDQNSVCRETNVSATVVPGFGGDGCSDIIEYRLYNGSTWSIWIAYPPSSNISYNANTAQIELRGYRSYCDVGTGCTSSDTNVVSWFITDNLTNPILLKHPNIDSICAGIDVYASIQTPGSGGIGCSDLLEYRINSGSGFSAWFAYGENDLIPTTGYTEVQIRGIIGNCASGDECPPADTTIYSWIVNPGLTGPSITKNPDVNVICRGTAVSATITTGSGGNGCTEYYQYRLYNGSTWTGWGTYVSGTSIAYNPSDVQVQVRAFRGNCNLASGCAASDTALANWDIHEFLVNPILEKYPDVDAICNVDEVSASINVPGSGGVGCSDILEYRIDAGSGFSAWQPYASADAIPTAGYTEIQVRGYIGNCISGDECPPADTTIYSWTIQPAPIAPTIAQIPNTDDVCFGTALSAIITPGSGGSSCTEVAQYRTYNGAIWSAWTAYTSGNNIPYGASVTQVELRAFRGNCNPLSGCESSDTTTASWNILNILVNPILTKIPAIATICQGTDVSATIQTPGTGGVGCSDILQYRTNSGAGFGAWLAYSLGDLLPTFGLTGVQIRGYIGNCISGDQCPPADTTIYNWDVSIPLIAPVVTRIPNSDTICRSTAISATITPGTGGTSCTNYSQFRTYNGTTWTAWATYTSGNNIPYGATITQVQVRAFRGNCDPLSGCTSSDTTLTSWTILNILVNPILTKNPAVAAVCQGTNVSATIQTPGTGGVGCSDILQYRTNSGAGFGAWLAYSTGDPLPSTGYTAIQIRGFIGNCISGSQCPPADTTIYNWDVSAPLIAPVVTRVPNSDTICRSTAISATITPGTGGTSCTNYSQFRTYNGTTWTAWAAYISGNNIPYGATITQVQVRAFRGNCDPLSGCTSSDTTLTSWTILNNLVNPILTKNPAVAAVCEGTDVSATIQTSGTGGVGCVDVLQYRTNSGAGFGAWLAYSTGDPLPSTGYTAIQIRGYIGNCISGSQCPPADTTIYNWDVSTPPTTPVITRVPNTDTICRSTAISATITPGTGGTSCTNYSQFRTYNGTTWTAWAAYTSGNNIPYGATITQVQVRAFRGNCDPLSGCTSSDTTLTGWTILNNLVNPILAKNPNTAAVCLGTDVSATIQTPGSAGAGCSDILEYRTNSGAGFGAWLTYSTGNAIPSTGLTAIQIRGYIGNCISGSQCPPADTTIYNWNVSTPPTAPVITRVPNTDTICRSTAISATITPGTGGTACTNYSQFRTFNGTTWTAWAAYASGNNIPYGATITQVQVRAFRGNCDPLSGCTSSDTTLTGWTILNNLVNPILAKNPNTAATCLGTDVSATIQTPGTGGVGCSDILQYRTNSGAGFGAWLTYSAGNAIPSTGLTAIQIRGYIGNCISGSQCPPSDTAIYSWNIVDIPQNPDIVRVPNEDDLCTGTAISAIITQNGGGVGCTDYSQYRTYNGATWTAWTGYTSGNNIAYPLGTTQVQVRAFRGDCSTEAGCTASDTIVVFWGINPQPIAPVLTKNPDYIGVCEGTSVSATVTTPGSGGVGCSDNSEYRIHNGTSWSAWLSYIPGTPIPTTGLTQVEIRSWRGACPIASCNSTDTTLLQWSVNGPATEPSIARTPNLDLICEGTTVSATITPGAGGVGCTDLSEYRTLSAGIWSAWNNYTSASVLNTSAIDSVEVRTYRICPPITGCSATDTNIVAWKVLEIITLPVMTKVPNIAGVCEGSSVSASLTIPGSGGLNCTDTYEYRTNDGSGFSAWQPYVPSNAIATIGLTQIEVRFSRNICDPLNVCAPPDPAIISWFVNPQPTAPLVTRVPDIDNVCNGTVLSGTITPGSGGVSCSDTYQYRYFNAGVWSVWMPYTSGNNLSYPATATQAEIRAFRANCEPASSCIATDTTLVSWNISLPITAPVMAKYPDIAGVCDGTPVSATLVTPGSGGLNCTDTYEYRINSGTGFGAWVPYIPGTPIVTNGLTEVEIRFGRNVCDPLNVCPPPAPETFYWFVAPQSIAPTIVRNPDIDSLCVGPDLSGTITPGSGGAGCVDVYEYRIQDTLGIWSPWMSYISNSIIHSSAIRSAQIRISRTNCFPGSGCTEYPPTQIEWIIFPQPIVPVLTRIPDQDAVCETTLLTAIQTGNIGGVPPTTIIYQNENPGEWTWNPGNSFVPNSNGMAYIRARATSNGYGCVDSEWEWVSWIVDPKPVITAPANQTICEGGSTILDAVVTGGYGTITYSWEMSTTSCTGPWAPIADSTRASLETGPLSDTTWYRITATQQATSCSDISPCIAVNVKPAPAVTISGNTIVCSGGTTLTANVTNEPNPVTYQWQFSNTATGPWVNTGTNNNTLNIPAVAGSLYYRCTVAGDTLGCTANSIATLVQLGTVPVISHQSSDTSICNGQNLFLNVSAQAVPSPAYQWYGPLGIIAGATSDTLYINNAQIGIPECTTAKSGHSAIPL